MTYDTLETCLATLAGQTEKRPYKISLKGAKFCYVAANSKLQAVNEYFTTLGGTVETVTQAEQNAAMRKALAANTAETK